MKQRVVILGGEVASWAAERDDAWDAPDVVDVSNQIRNRGASLDQS